MLKLALVDTEWLLFLLLFNSFQCAESENGSLNFSNQAIQKLYVCKLKHFEHI